MANDGVSNPNVYYRSEKTNDLFEKLCVDHGVEIILRVPGLGEVTLVGDNAREFLWTVRSNKSASLIDGWLARLKMAVQAVQRKDD